MHQELPSLRDEYSLLQEKIPKMKGPEIQVLIYAPNPDSTVVLTITSKATHVITLKKK
jgi:hypothetical protein